MVVGLAQDRDLAELGHVALRYGKSGCNALWCSYYRRRIRLQGRKSDSAKQVALSPTVDPAGQSNGRTREGLVAAYEAMGAARQRLSGSLRKPHRVTCRVAHKFAFRNVADVAPPKGKLHDALALAGEECRARSGFRVLLDAVDVVGEILKAHRA